MSRSIVKGTPWTFRGVKDVRDCTSSEEVMKKAGLDFSVTKCPIVAEMPWSGQSRDKIDIDHFIHNTNIYASVDGAYATYRTDILEPLGLVKSKYEVVQNIDAFKFFDDAIGIDKAIWQTAGQFDNGSRIFVTAKVPFDMSFTGGDAINTYLVFTNAHDGSHGVDILFTPIRVVCQNTLNAAIRTSDCHIRFRHTQSVHDRINQAAEILGITEAKAKFAKEQYQAMKYISMTDDNVKDYIAKLFLSETEYKAMYDIDKDSCLRRLFYREFTLLEDAKISMRKANMCAAALEYYFDGEGQQNIKGTGWGAYNAITGYYSNVANLEGEKRLDSLLYGNAARVTSTAMELILKAA